MSFWPTAAFVVMVLSWVAFVIVFATQKKAPSSPDNKRDPVSILGIALQGASYAAVWVIRRPWFTPMFPPNRSLEIALSVLVMVLAVAALSATPTFAAKGGGGGGGKGSATTYTGSFSLVLLNSTDGLYDPAKRQAHADLSLSNTGHSDLHNAFVYGNLSYSGKAPKNCTNVQGTISTPFIRDIRPTTDPTWAPGDYVQYPGGGNPPASGVFVANGTASNPTRIKVVGDFTVPGGKTFSIVSDPQVDGYLVVWVTGKFTTSGSGRMNQDPTAHVIWIVDKDVNTSGEAYQNHSGKAANLSLSAVRTGKVTLSGSAGFIGTIQGAERDLTITGAGGLSGAILANTLNLGGGSGIHCDEALTSP